MTFRKNIDNAKNILQYKRRKQMKLILKLNLLIAITANPARRLVSPVPNVVLNNLRIIGHVKYVQAA